MNNWIHIWFKYKSSMKSFTWRAEESCLACLSSYTLRTGSSMFFSLICHHTCCLASLAAAVIIIPNVFAWLMPSFFITLWFPFPYVSDAVKKLQSHRWLRTWGCFFCPPVLVLRAALEYKTDWCEVCQHRIEIQRRFKFSVPFHRVLISRWYVNVFYVDVDKQL